jgi:hypothetical protein
MKWTMRAKNSKGMESDIGHFSESGCPRNRKIAPDCETVIEGED